MLFSRVVGTIALVLGLLGLAVCAAGGYAVWRAGARLQHANDRVFALVDQGLGAVEGRVHRIQERAEQSRITADDISMGLRNWADRRAVDRVASHRGASRAAGVFHLSPIPGGEVGPATGGDG
jgi:hypothetical protein